MDKHVKYWIELAEYDLDTARAVLEKKRYLHVGFMCHQTIEKMLKAVWQHTLKTVPPKTHNLNYLLQKTSLDSAIPEAMAETVDELEPLNIQARYPEYKDELFKKMNHEYCEKLMLKTLDLYAWIKNKL